MAGVLNRVIASIFKNNVIIIVWIRDSVCCQGAKGFVERSFNAEE